MQIQLLNFVHMSEQLRGQQATESQHRQYASGESLSLCDR
jgi:hypothetical protein